MASVEEYCWVVEETVGQTALDFHIEVEGYQPVPFPYQIAEETYDPFQLGKAEPGLVKARFTEAVAAAIKKNQDPGIQNEASIRQILDQLNLGSDCSNLMYRGYDNVMDVLGFDPYRFHVYWPSEEFHEQYETNPRFRTNPHTGEYIELSSKDAAYAYGNEAIPVDWIAQRFARNPAFITGTRHIASGLSSVEIEPDEVLPGDMVTFAKEGRIGHLAVVAGFDLNPRYSEGERRIRFWHSWTPRDHMNGVRLDWVDVAENAPIDWSHEGLNDPSRYTEHQFRRPRILANYVADLPEVT